MRLMLPKSKELLMILNMIRNISFERRALQFLSIFIDPLINLGMDFVKKKEFHKVKKIIKLFY